MSTANLEIRQTQSRLPLILRGVAASLRFSLRELFLVTMVCAALAAWVHEKREHNRPLRQSHIAEYFTSDFQKDVIAARAGLGEKGDAWSFAPNSCMDLRGDYKPEHCLNREWFCQLWLPWDKARQFHDELVRRIGTHIRRGQPGEDYSPSEEYEGGSTIDIPADFLGDTTKYHCGDVHGTIRVYLSKCDNQNAKLIAVLNEHRVP